MFVVNSHRSVADSCMCESTISAASAPHMDCIHTANEIGLCVNLIYSSQNQACAVCKLLHDCKNKNCMIKHLGEINIYF